MVNTFESLPEMSRFVGEINGKPKIIMDVTEHLLTCLAEEAAEIVKDATKSLRFGAGDRFDPTGPSNVERLVNELNDLVAVVSMLTEDGILPADWHDPEKQMWKRRRVTEFMNYARRVGALDRVRVDGNWEIK